jgi:hypothetical protein
VAVLEARAQEERLELAAMGQLGVRRGLAAVTQRVPIPLQALAALVALAAAL